MLKRQDSGAGRGKNHTCGDHGNMTEQKKSKRGGELLNFPFVSPCVFVWTTCGTMTKTFGDHCIKDSLARAAVAMRHTHLQTHILSLSLTHTHTPVRAAVAVREAHKQTHIPTRTHTQM